MRADTDQNQREEEEGWSKLGMKDTLRDEASEGLLWKSRRHISKGCGSEK